MRGDPIEVAQLVLVAGGGSDVAEAAILIDAVGDRRWREGFATAFSRTAVALAERALRASMVRLVGRAHVSHVRSALVAIARDRRVLLLSAAERLSAVRQLRARDASAYERLRTELREVHAPVVRAAGYPALADAIDREHARIDLPRIDDAFVHALTPIGEVKRLRRGATALDFAYAIHTELGRDCIGAKIDGAHATLDAPLEDGEVVEILRSLRAQPPARQLASAHTAHARNRIRHALIPLGPRALGSR